MPWKIDITERRATHQDNGLIVLFEPDPNDPESLEGRPQNPEILLEIWSREEVRERAPELMQEAANAFINALIARSSSARIG